MIILALEPRMFIDWENGEKLIRILRSFWILRTFRRFGTFERFRKVR